MRAAIQPASFVTKHLRCFTAVLVVSAFGLACGKSDPPGQPSSANSGNSGGEGRGKANASGVWFEDVAQASGIDFVHEFGPQRYWIPEVTGSGVGLFDADGDGDLDVYALQGCDLAGERSKQPQNRMYANQGDGKFVDVTESSGTGDRGFGMGCAVGDYDGDGDLDLYVTNVGPNVLYRNRGDGTFEDVSKTAGVDLEAWSTSASFVDYDGDGHLDLFVTNYLIWQPSHEAPCVAQGVERGYCNPDRYQGSERDTLFRNKGDGTFEDLSLAKGLDQAYGPGLGVVWGFWNGDQETDFYVANDGEANQLWYGGNEKMQEKALLSGCALSGNGQAEAGMGIVMGDMDRNGTWDLMVTHLRGQTHTYYSGGRRGFRDATNKTGTGNATRPYTGFGLGWFDFDHDGIEDLYVASGRVVLTRPVFSEEDVLAEPDQVFPGTAPGRFGEALPNSGTAQQILQVGRGAAFGDIDNDGDVDVVINNNGTGMRVLRNVAPKAGDAVQFTVLERDGLPAVGARLQIEVEGAKRLFQVQRTSSYCASNDPRVHVGWVRPKRSTASW